MSRVQSPVSPNLVLSDFHLLYKDDNWERPCLFSSVVEHQSRKLGVVGSNPTGGIFQKFGKFFTQNGRSWQGSNLRGQSPLDFKSNALTTRPQLHRYNVGQKFGWRCGGLNPGPFTCKANALPLSYIPQSWISQDLVGSPLSTWMTKEVNYSINIWKV